MPNLRILQTILIFTILVCFSAESSGRIVFSAQQNKNFGIYVIDDDGSGLTKISSYAQRQGQPRWSPNGKQIAFLRDTDLSNFVSLNTYIMDVNGRNLHRISDVKGHTYGLAFSPVGAKLILSKTLNRGARANSFGLYVLDIRTATETKRSNILVREVDWSPDGKEIIFVHIEFGVIEKNFWIINADGTNPHPWIPIKKNVNRGKPRWSPNGQQILFVETDLQIVEHENGILIKPAGTYRYIIRDANGGGEKILDIPRSWTPNAVSWMDHGKAILICAFDDVDHLNDPDRSTQLYRYDLATKEITQLTHSLEHKMDIDWVSDHVYAVDLLGKYPLRWGELKKKRVLTK